MQYCDTFFQKRIPSTDNRNNLSKFPELTSSVSFPNTQCCSPGAGSSEAPAAKHFQKQIILHGPLFVVMSGSPDKLFFI